MGAVDIKDQFLTLPLKNVPGLHWSHNGWRYQNKEGNLVDTDLLP
jgi:hypothetical protein